MSRLKKYLLRSFEKHHLRDKQFIMVSNNCWGLELYHSTAKAYNTPFIGMLLYPDCYIAFLEDFEACLNSDISFTAVSKYEPHAFSYPVARLGDHIELHFFHETSEEEALEKWKRRVKRLKKAMSEGTPLFFKLCDRDGCNTEHIRRFHATPFQNKISIGVNAFNHPNHFHQPELKDEDGHSVVDGYKLFAKRYHYFDITNWIVKGRAGQTIYSRILSYFS